MKERLSQLDYKNPKDYAEYIEVKTNLEVAELCNEFKDDSWQCEIIQSYVSPVIREYNQYKYSIEDKSQDDLKKEEELKQEYDELAKKLKSDDWRYFANKNKDEIQSQINATKETLATIEDNSAKKEIEEQMKQYEMQMQCVNWRLEKDIPYGTNYLSNQINMYSNYSMYSMENETNLENKHSQKREKQRYIEKANLAKYDIENMSYTGDSNNAKGMLEDTFESYEMIIIVVIVMIAGVMISEEFNKGTIKLLLVRPYKRNKILLAKFITSILMIFITIVFVILVQALIGGIIYGFDSFNIPVTRYNFNDNTVISMNVFKYLALIAITKLPIYILITTLSFAFSTLTCNSAVAIALPLLGYMGSSMINMIAESYNLNWVRFFVTPNWDLSRICIWKTTNV